jgi:hypothetical protein
MGTGQRHCKSRNLPWELISNRHFLVIKLIEARRQWLTSVILATQEAEIRRITVPSQPGQIVHESLS